MHSTHKKAALINALCFFFIWLLILYAIADHPVPKGFYGIILADLIAAVIVFWRVPTYIHWTINRKKNRRWRVLLDGVIAGATAGLLILFINRSNMSGGYQVFDYIMLVLIFGIAGIGSSGIVYVINALIFRKKRVDKQLT